MSSCVKTPHVRECFAGAAVALTLDPLAQLDDRVFLSAEKTGKMSLSSIGALMYLGYMSDNAQKQQILEHSYVSSSMLVATQ